MAEQRNLILAVVLSILVLLGFEVVWRAVFPPPPVEQTEMAVPLSPEELDRKKHAIFAHEAYD